VASQAQQWKWLKRDYPDLWDKVKEKVDDRTYPFYRVLRYVTEHGIIGKFLPIGGAWVRFYFLDRVKHF
jgi:hypothetical protein